jgi:Transposase DDE domain
VNAPSPHSLRRYAERCLGLKKYLRQPGDGRLQPMIAACTLLWALLLARILREIGFYAVEQLVRSASCTALGVQRTFGDDALGYFTERLDPAVTRAALVQTLHRAKRNKAFENSRFLGLAIDGTTAGHSIQHGCDLCRPQHNAKKEVIGYSHQLATISVVGAGLSLPFDGEPYGPGDSEYAAGQRLLARALAKLGPRFADYLVVDGEYATAPFLHAADRVGIKVVARLKENLPELSQSVERRFASQSPTRTFRDGKDRIEIWDADDFAPWETLHWDRVRVVRYRQHKPDGSVIQAEWLTNFPLRQVGSLSLYHIAKSRWEIENQGFNDAKNRYGLEHICHHEQHSILLVWLITFLAIMIERLYRIRYLHRGTHRRHSAGQLCRLLWLSLAGFGKLNSS